MEAFALIIGLAAVPIAEGISNVSIYIQNDFGIILASELALLAVSIYAKQRELGYVFAGLAITQLITGLYDMSSGVPLGFGIDFGFGF